MIPLFLSAIVNRLSKLSLAQIVAALLAICCTVQFVALKMEKRHSAKVGLQLARANAELARISTAKNDQQRETTERIKIVERTIHDADGRARIVETAPPAPDCKTNPAVMGADL